MTGHPHPHPFRTHPVLPVRDRPIGSIGPGYPSRSGRGFRHPDFRPSSCLTVRGRSTRASCSARSRFGDAPRRRRRAPVRHDRRDADPEARLAQERDVDWSRGRRRHGDRGRRHLGLSRRRPGRSVRRIPAVTLALRWNVCRSRRGSRSLVRGRTTIYAAPVSSPVRVRRPRHPACPSCPFLWC